MFKHRTEQTRFNRRRAVRAFGGAAAVAALLGTLRRGSSARAEHDPHAIVGTWIVDVPVGQRAGKPIRWMAFFFREGIVQLFESPQGPTNVQTDAPEALEYQTVSLGGQWVQTGVNEYVAVTIGLDYDALGNPTTMDHSRMTIRHDRVADTLTITSEFSETDAGGAETARITGTLTGTRVKVGP